MSGCVLVDAAREWGVAGAPASRAAENLVPAYPCSMDRERMSDDDKPLKGLIRPLKAMSLRELWP